MTLNLPSIKLLNKVIASVIFFCLFFNSLSLRALDVSVSKIQYSTENQNYLEVYLHFVAKSFEVDSLLKDKFLCQAEVTILLEQDGAVYSYEKYILNSPISNHLHDFQDMKRFVLPSGEYNLVIDIIDQNDISNAFKLEEKISISAQYNTLNFADMQYLASVGPKDSISVLSKNGFSFEVLPYDFYNQKYEELNFYTELYLDTTLVEDLYLYMGLYQEYWEEQNDKKLISQSIKKIKPQPIVPLLRNFDIRGLPSGNYHVRLEVRNRGEKVLAFTNKNFQRSNPYVDFEVLQKNDGLFENSFVHSLEAEKLDYYLKAHIPIAQLAMNNVLNTIIESDNERSKRYFIYKYWTDQSRDHGQVMFNKFMEVADAIDKMYNSGFGYGFETDRGYYYLKYGRPSQSINVSDEVSAPPYEMWVYDRINETGQSNVKFIFYNPSLATNDYRILHSTCLGEKRNLQWETVLYGNVLSEDAAGPGGFDNTTAPDNFGRNARQLFNDL